MYICLIHPTRKQKEYIEKNIFTFNNLGTNRAPTVLVNINERVLPFAPKKFDVWHL